MTGCPYGRLQKIRKDWEEMDTKIIDVTGISEETERMERLREAAMCLRGGGLVAFPTETVYGLGADGCNPEASARIYAAKGRPSDNPLIMHIAEMEQVERLAYPNELSAMLAEAFWPGPLTIILPKRDCVPFETTGGLRTVAIRMPSHPAALALIRQSGVCVAAPSANISGRPSPTLASHVIEDMDGRIDYIIDGGAVGIGIESTIVDVSGKKPVILRPGFITREMLQQIVGPVELDPAMEHPSAGMRPKAPGMKYTHYAPKGELTLVEQEGISAAGESAAEGTAVSTEDGRSRVVEKILSLAEEKRKDGYHVGIMCPRETAKLYEDHGAQVVCVGDRRKQATVAAGLYAALREFDAAGAEYIYAESFPGDGLSYAIMNRLLKAAGHRVIRV